MCNEELHSGFFDSAFFDSKHSKTFSSVFGFSPLSVSVLPFFSRVHSRSFLISGMRLRVRSSSGNDIITLDNDSVDVAGLLRAIKDSQKLNSSPQNDVDSIKQGFPPRLVDLTNYHLPLEKAGIKNGDLLLVSFRTTKDSGAKSDTNSGVTDAVSTSLSTPTATTSPSEPSIPSVFLSPEHLILRNIPDDNSCMFNALAYCIYGPDSYKPHGTCPPPKLRKIIAGALAADPLQYDELVLGRPIDKYIEWIQTKNAWGGAIELGILAKHFQIRINCIDIELGSIIRFQDESDEAPKPEYSIYLVYLGVHYDVVALNKVLTLQHRPDDVCKFTIDSPLEQKVETGVYDLCKKLQTQNYTTNTTTFRVRCLECYKILVGETGASRHANETGHYLFGEVTK